MRLTVDASVVIKWSVPEELTDNARLLRAHRLELHAPDLLLAEFANVCWKKFRRGQLPEITEHLDSIGRLSDDITLHSLGALILRAAGISLALDHPVYDCLYLACAEETGSPFVTADQRLANKVGASALGIPVRYLGADDFRDDIGAAGVAPVIARTTVEALAEAYDLLSVTEETVESVALSRLTTLLRSLSADERIDLLALARFGRPAGAQWRTCHEQACSDVITADVTDLVLGGPFWKRGMERLFDAAL